MEKLIYRHNRITRATHWINALALMILVMSGFQIFNAHPYLYWGSASEPDRAFLAIAAANDDGEVRGFFRLYGWQFDTTGVLGVQNTAMGPAARAFPSWLTIPGYFWLAGGRRWHFFFAWLFALNGLLYVVYNIATGHLRKFLCTAKDVARVPAMVLYYLHIHKESPQEGEYNPLQKLAYTSVFLVLTPFFLLSGMAMSPQLDTAFHWLPAMFGGRQSARSIHFILAFLFVGFTFGHVFMALATGVFNNMRSMVSGWYKEKVSERPEPAPVQETLPPSVEPEQQDSGELQSSTPDERPALEGSAQSSATQSPESKKDTAE
jgi:Ni/Fe-hydrogenase b-type cytochrome subunit